MATANEDLFDAMLRQQVNLQRLTQGEVRAILTELRRADTEVQSQLAARLVEQGVEDFTSDRLSAVLTEIRKQRNSIIETMGNKLGGIVKEVVDIEVDATVAMLQRSVPVEVNFASPNISAVRELAREEPFGRADLMQSLGEWVVDLKEADQRRIAGALQAGATQGESIPQLMRRVRKAQDMTMQNAEAITRTAMNHAANTARQEVFNENADIIQALRWTATLDGRTSAICRARDGHFDALQIGGEMKDVPSPHIQGSPRRPPGHIRCRSLMIAILDGQSIADDLPERPFVRDSRTRRTREKDFRKDAREKVGKDRWKEMSRKERNAEIKDVRRDWADKNIGTVPGDVDYDTWLRRQPEAFQNEVLGPTKAEGFRNGIKTDQFIDVQGNELTIEQMRAKSPSKMPAADDMTDAQVKRVKIEDARREVEIAEAKTAKAVRKAEKAQAKAELETKRRRQAEAKAARLGRERENAERMQRQADLQAEQVRANSRRVDIERRNERNLDPNKSNAINSKTIDDLRIQTTQEVLDRHGLTSAQELVTKEMRDELFDLYARRLRAVVPHGEDSVAYLKFIEGMSVEEISELYNWGGGSGAIRALQQGDFIDSVHVPQAGVQRSADVLEALIKRSPDFEGDHLFRGIAMPVEDAAKLSIGDDFIERAISSYSFDPGVATEFADDSFWNIMDAEAQRVILKTEGSVGDWAANVQNLTERTGHITFEAEVLMSSRAKWEISNIRSVPGDGATYLEVTLRAKR